MKLGWWRVMKYMRAALERLNPSMFQVTTVKFERLIDGGVGGVAASTIPVELSESCSLNCQLQGL